jgi:SAM-dependent methyltransferase
VLELPFIWSDSGIGQGLNRIVWRGLGKGDAMTTASRPHDAGAYGSWIADDYDALYAGLHETEATVECLAELAAGGAVLELGVGTGRVAIPLAATGLEVHGLDGSAEMLAALQTKPGGDAVVPWQGDFAELNLGRAFGLVALLVNTIYALPDQDAQVRCFQRVAEHLEPGGRFVVEAWIPEALPAGESLRPRKLADGLIGLVVADNDPVAQVLSTIQIALGTQLGVRVFPVVHRYAWPSELDLMARLAGLEREARWADWARTPLAPASRHHVTVYRRPA